MAFASSHQLVAPHQLGTNRRLPTTPSSSQPLSIRESFSLSVTMSAIALTVDYLNSDLLQLTCFAVSRSSCTGLRLGQGSVAPCLDPYPDVASLIVIIIVSLWLAAFGGGLGTVG